MFLSSRRSPVVRVGLEHLFGHERGLCYYQTNVINAANRAYARPLWITESGIRRENIPVGQPGAAVGNAMAGDLSAAELASGAASISADISYMHTNLGFVAGAFYFEYSDEWWKNAEGSPFIHDGVS